MAFSNRVADGIGPSSGGVLDRAGFRDVLRRERACSDRSHLPFAVLAFRAGAVPDEELRDVIVTRIRETDTVGWLENDELGVLLRHASVSDAVHVAEEIRERVTGADGPPRCTVYGYPPFWFERPPHEAAPRQDGKAGEASLGPADRRATEAGRSAGPTGIENQRRDQQGVTDASGEDAPDRAARESGESAGDEPAADNRGGDAAGLGRSVPGALAQRGGLRP